MNVDPVRLDKQYVLAPGASAGIQQRSQLPKGLPEVLLGLSGFHIAPQQAGQGFPGVRLPPMEQQIAEQFLKPCSIEATQSLAVELRGELAKEGNAQAHFDDLPGPERWRGRFLLLLNRNYSIAPGGDWSPDARSSLDPGDVRAFTIYITVQNY